MGFREEPWKTPAATERVDSIQDRYKRYLDLGKGDIFSLSRKERDGLISYVVQAKVKGGVETYIRCGQQVYLADAYAEIAETEIRKGPEHCASGLVPRSLEVLLRNDKQNIRSGTHGIHQDTLVREKKIVRIRSEISTDMRALELVPRPVVGMSLGYFEVVARYYPSLSDWTVVGYREELDELLCVLNSGFDAHNDSSYKAISVKELYLLLNHPVWYLSDAEYFQ